MPLDGDEGMGWDYFLQNRSAMAESQIVEYKESWRDEYLKWICGFANAQGGVIYIGRKDDGTPCGVEDSKRLLETFYVWIMTFPLLNIRCMAPIS